MKLTPLSDETTKLLLQWTRTASINEVVQAIVEEATAQLQFTHTAQYVKDWLKDAEEQAGDKWSAVGPELQTLIREITTQLHGQTKPSPEN